MVALELGSAEENLNNFSLFGTRDFPVDSEFFAQYDSEHFNILSIVSTPKGDTGDDP